MLAFFTVTVPTTRQGFAIALRDARVGRGLSLRATARAVGLPPSTLQGWFDGRHLPTLALQDQFCTLLKVLGLERESDEWLRALDALRGGGPVGANPYLGIQSYGTDDAERYFGRERILDELVAAIDTVQSSLSGKVVAVVGLSGAGKTSLLQAGLVGRECGPAGRLAHFAPVLINVADVPDWAPGGEPTLLIVDHFEAIQTLDDHAREQAVVALVGQPEHVTCVIAMVADAYGYAVADERLHPALGAPVLLSALSDDEFTEIIRCPAQGSGRSVDDTLVALIRRDLHRYGPPAPSVLPLLSNSLFRTWEHATGTTVGVQDYMATGGLWGGLERLAEGIYQGATPDDQLRIRRLFLSLVQVTRDGIERRSVELAAVPESDWGFVDQYLTARLLSISGSTLVISHSALLGRWARLAAWADEERDVLLFRRRLSKAAEVWEESRRDPNALVPVDALLLGDYVEERDFALNRLETEYLEASVARAEDQGRAQRREIAKLRRRNHVITALGAVATALFLVAMVSAVRIGQVSEDAQLAKAEAQSRQLALIAEETRPTDRNVAAQLSLAAYRLSPTAEAAAAVLKSAGLQAPWRILGPAGTVRVVARQDGQLLARAASDGSVHVWRGADFASPPDAFTVSDGQLFGLGHGEVAGRQLLAVAGQNTASVWDVTTAEATRLVEVGAEGTAYSAVIGGGVAYFGMLDGTVQRVDLTTAEPTRLESWIYLADTAVQTIAVSPDGRTVVAGGTDTVMAWRSDGERLWDETFERWITQLAFSPDGGSLVAAGGGGHAVLFDVNGDGAERVRDISQGPLSIHSAAVGEDLIVLGSASGEVTALDRSGARLGMFAEPSAVTGLTLVGDRPVTGTLEGTVRIWPDRPSGLLVTGSDTRDPADLNEGLVTKFLGDSVLVFDTAGAELHRVPKPESASGGFNVNLVSEELLVVPTADGRLATWSLADGASTEPTYSIVGEGSAYVLLRSPQDDRALYAEANVDRAFVLERDGLTWTVADEFETWSTLAMGWHPTEPVVAAMSVDSTELILYDASALPLSELGRVAVPSDGAAVVLEWASAGGTLFIGTDSGYVFEVDVTDPANPAVTRTVDDLHSGVKSLTISDQGDRLAAGLVDGRIHVWHDTEEGFQPELALRPGKGPVSELMFDDDRLVFITDDEGIYAWPLDAEAAAAQICDQIGQPLDAHEWGHLAAGVPAVEECS